MDAPTPDQVRDRSALLTARYSQNAENDELLQERIAEEVPVVADLTGRAIGGAPGVPVPDYLVPVAEAAIALRIERAPLTAKDAQKGIGTLRLRSFTAGPYSETYFTPGDLAALKALDPDRRIHELLWTLATEDKRAYWVYMWGGPIQPGVAVQTFNWRGRVAVDSRRINRSVVRGYPRV